jgi:hypothetical protein
MTEKILSDISRQDLRSDRISDFCTWCTSHMDTDFIGIRNWLSQPVPEFEVTSWIHLQYLDEMQCAEYSRLLMLLSTIYRFLVL